MSFFLDKLSLYFVVCRGYSLPISLMSCVIPFLYASLSGGNLMFGIIATMGVLILHLGTNLFDDVVDYYREKKDIDSGKKSDFNFQNSKCAYIRNGKVSFKSALILSLFLFFISFLIGVFFTYLLGIKLLFVLIPSAIICILYPILGCLGLGEILVAIVFSPLIYSGIYYVMTGSFSNDILIFSISTGLLAVAVLHNHMLLDYRYDTTNRKVTLSRLCGNEFNAFILLIFILLFAYVNLIVWIFSGKLSYIYLLPVFSFPVALTLINVMRVHIDNPDKKIKYNICMGSLNAINKYPEEHRNFMMKFMLVQNVLNSFSFLLCISMLIDKLVLK